MKVSRMLSILESMPDKDAEVIIVDQLTGIITKPELLSHDSGNKVVIIEKNYSEYREQREKAIDEMDKVAL